MPFFFLFFFWSTCPQASYTITSTNCLQFVPRLVPLWISVIATYLHASEKSRCKLRPPRPNCTCGNWHTHACRAHLYPVNLSSSHSYMPSFISPPSEDGISLLASGRERLQPKDYKNKKVPKVLGYRINYYLRLK